MRDRPASSPAAAISRGKRLVFALALIFVALVACLIVLEVASRLAYPHWRNFWPVDWLRYDPVVGTFRGRPDYRGHMADAFGEYFVPIRLDRRGFRNPPGASLEKAKLVVLGDSFAFGWGVRREEIFPAVAGRLLGWPVYDLGVPGTDLSDYLVIARHFLPRARGKTVAVTVTFENDLHNYPPARLLRRPAPESAVRSLIGELLSHSALASVVAALGMKSPFIVALIRRYNLMSSRDLPRGNGDYSSQQATARLIVAMAKALRPDRFWVLMVPPRPGRHQEGAYQRFVRLLRNAGLEVIDPSPLLSKMASPYYPVDGHWRPVAHRLAGEMLARRLGGKKVDLKRVVPGPREVSPSGPSSNLQPCY